MLAAGASLPQHEGTLRGVKLFPVSRRQISKLHFPDLYPDEAQGGMADGGGHFPYLTVFSLLELQADPAVGHGFTVADGRLSRRQGGLGLQNPGPARERWATFQRDALGKLVEGIRGRDSFHLGPVVTGVALFGIEHSGVEAGLVAEKKQAFRVRIQAAQGIDSFRKTEFSEGSVR